MRGVGLGVAGLQLVAHLLALQRIKRRKELQVDVRDQLLLFLSTAQLLFLVFFYGLLLPHFLLVYRLARLLQEFTIALILVELCSVNTITLLCGFKAGATVALLVSLVMVGIDIAGPPYLGL